VKPWERKFLTDRQRLLTGLANETVWIGVLEEVLFSQEGSPAETAAQTRALLAEATTMGIDSVEIRGLPEYAELAEAVAEYRDLYKKLYGTRRGGGPTRKSKLGRPSIWRGPMGWYFFHAVTKARTSKPRSIAAAIEWVKKNDPHLKDLLSRFTRTALQVRYQEAAAEWSWVLRGDEHTAMQGSHAAAFDRVHAAFKAWVSFHEREEGRPFIKEHIAEKLRALKTKRAPDFP
jgi:hypothetical protein